MRLMPRLGPHRARWSHSLAGVAVLVLCLNFPGVRQRLNHLGSLVLLTAGAVSEMPGAALAQAPQSPTCAQVTLAVSPLTLVLAPVTLTMSPSPQILSPSP